ncbi:MAG: hypothetical protein AAF573_09600 [Bacteroidota bacterium]
MSKPLYRCTLEFAHFLGHGGTADHTLASHTDGIGNLAHGHDFLQIAHSAVGENDHTFPNPRSSNSDLKLKLICTNTFDEERWLVMNTPSNDRPYYREVFLPSLYTPTLIDPPDLA